MKKIKAFTITELMVVALLTVVTVALAMTAWQIMQQQYLQYGSDSEKALQLGLGPRAIVADHFGSRDAAHAARNLQCLTRRITVKKPGGELIARSRRVHRDDLTHRHAGGFIALH